MGVMVNVLFGTSLQVPLLLIARYQNENFCIFKKPPEARRRSLLSCADLRRRSRFSASDRFLVESVDT